MNNTTKKIRLEYTTLEGAFTATSWHSEVSQAVEALAKAYSNDVNFLHVKFKKVVVNGKDLGAAGVQEADAAFKTFCT